MWEIYYLMPRTDFCFVLKPLHWTVIKSICGNLKLHLSWKKYPGWLILQKTTPDFTNDGSCAKINDCLKIDTFITLPVTIMEINSPSYTIHNTIIPTSWIFFTILIFYCNGSVNSLMRYFQIRWGSFRIQSSYWPYTSTNCSGKSISQFFTRFLTQYL